MRLRLQVVARAERQIREASHWWDQNRRAAPNLFYEELGRAFELITTQPDIGPVAADAELPGLRHLDLLRIRYWLYYRVQPKRKVQVLAFWHASRGDGPPLR